VLEWLEANAMRARRFFTKALSLVGFVLVVVAVKEDHLTVAFERQNVRRNSVKEPTIVRGHQCATGKFKQCFFQRTQGFNV
jgi:hypothetical protein